MAESVVALTDFSLTAACLYFAWSLRRCAPRFWAALFVSLAASSAFGGILHGFGRYQTTIAHDVFWLATLVSLGVTGAITWLITGDVSAFGSTKFKTGWKALASSWFIVYCVILVVGHREFAVAIANYLPPTLALFIISIRGYAKADRRRESQFFGRLCAGLTLSFIAAGIQLAGLAVHPVYFNHNATYHTVQGLGLWLMYRAAYGLAQA